MSKDSYNRSIKINTRTYNFLIKFRKNRVKKDIDDSTIGFGKAVEVIYDHFLEDDESYQKAVKKEYIKNV